MLADVNCRKSNALEILATLSRLLKLENSTADMERLMINLLENNKEKRTDHDNQYYAFLFLKAFSHLVLSTKSCFNSFSMSMGTYETCFLQSDLSRLN